MLVRDDEIATCDAKFALTGSCERQKVNLLILLFGHLSVPDYHQRMSFDTQRVLFAKRRTFFKSYRALGFALRQRSGSDLA